ncbi:MAG: EAL domain-containing protein [Pseudomonadota bacterium]
MRIQQFLLLAMLMLSVPLLALLLGLSSLSWREHVQDRNSGSIARATAAWIDGQVALSLERSLTQVAFELDPETRDDLVMRLSSQRLEVNRHFENALSEIGDGLDQRTQRLEGFQGHATALLGTLAQTRRDVDAALQQPYHCAQDCEPLVAELIQIIDETAALRAALSIPSDQITTQSYDFLQLQYLAWEAREFAGRVRTPYVVATIKAQPFSDRERALIDEHMRLVDQTWNTLQNVAQRLDPNNPVITAIETAQSVYHEEHTALLRQIDAFLATGEGSSIPGFEDFFESSTSALATISNVASFSGEEIENYWREQQQSSIRSFWLTSLGSALAIAAVIAVVTAVRGHLVRPIMSATNLLSRVADGELDATEKPATLRLSEIMALHTVVDRFRFGLRQAHAAEIEARTDHLTNLPNRRDMEEQFASEGRAFADGDALFYVDLDEFKPINDSFGHQAGDKVLQEVANRLLRFSGDGKEVWRLGGDEFGFVVRGVHSLNAASDIAERLHQIVSAPISHHGEELFVGASIGVALHDASVLHFQDMFSRADVAMFTAKQSPTNNVEIHRDTIQNRRYSQDSRRRISAALGAGEIFPMFQPQIDLMTGEIVGFEALARWRREDGALMAPGEFIDMVEYFGALGELDLLIAERTLHTMRNLHSSNKSKPGFSINVSEESLASREIRNDFLNLFAKYQDLTPKLTVEVTENALIDRSAQAIRASLQSFAEAGISLSMDDFGTGYGSFRHLQEYKFDEIKIDRSFVSKVCLDRSSEVIISGFLDVARGLEARVVAEGVETEQQHMKLVELGCRLAQGHLFAHPVPASELNDTLNGVTQMAS